MKKNLPSTPVVIIRRKGNSGPESKPTKNKNKLSEKMHIPKENPQPPTPPLQQQAFIKNKFKLTEELKSILRDNGILRLDKDIRQIDPQEIVHYFGAFSSGRLLLEPLTRSIIWQAYERIQEGKEPPIRGNLRHFWYQWFVPVLIKIYIQHKIDLDYAYELMGKVLRYMTLDRKLFQYANFEFVDDNWHHRRIGKAIPEVIVFSEKVGNFHFLNEIHNQFSVTIVGIFGSPSAITSECIFREITKALSRPKRIRLLGIVDYTPPGDIIATAFKKQLELIGFSDIKLTNIIHPDNYPPKELELFRTPLVNGQGSRKLKDLNNWLEKTGGINGEAYGIESESMPRDRLLALVRDSIFEED